MKYRVTNLIWCYIPIKQFSIGFDQGICLQLRIDHNFLQAKISIKATNDRISYVIKKLDDIDNEKKTPSSFFCKPFLSAILSAFWKTICFYFYLFSISFITLIFCKQFCSFTLFRSCTFYTCNSGHYPPTFSVCACNFHSHNTVQIYFYSRIQIDIIWTLVWELD